MSGNKDFSFEQYAVMRIRLMGLFDNYNKQLYQGTSLEVQPQPTQVTQARPQPDVNSTSGQRKRGRPRLDHNRECYQCHTTKTSEWRTGEIPNTFLCNACGLKVLKKKKKESQTSGSLKEATFPFPTEGVVFPPQELKMKGIEMTDLSIVVPTYNEVDNIEELITTLEKTLGDKMNYEILVMDDNSPDKTGAKVQELQKAGHKCEATIRTTNKGLSPAVIEGFDKAKGDVILVMDADLQHPISVVPKLFEAIKNGAEVAVGSRHCPGGGIENWAFHRRVISWGAALLARHSQTKILKEAKLEAKGYKILLEVLVKTHAKHVVEVPITFTTRTHGESKLTGGVMTNYLIHLFHLFMYPGTAPLLKFLVVGVIGTLVDVSVFSMLNAMGLNPSLAQAFSFACGLCNNFFLNSLWTFPQNVDTKEKTKQFVKFATVCGVSFILRSILFTIGRMYVPDQFPYIQMLLIFVIASLTIVNFVGSKLFVFN
ncbi:Undecaprenyl-phosphate 4-deoxy-4-formamido-L-arabinose transferase, putative [Entamoeba invadens IP1]|uniref:Undecaprenyl-phosphate 4-deoxy-4-formamido-L-arabinose transferase, putative n=1 Tax=Entamoeba invadens IP1 TaxID=370355 RepID=UPI0002C3D6EE|nr:Undecaprenyl-phosphate 4-deoxy-4-formamido-L-arabinose transferase, putative [Entamoeba invadens IP1]ELP85096.1 Undecaprenyl-phosphate 4-deoxy-4-formamido-L-arabinose transferase, putative [Entamoeba invadens IP1]|eukprot:XP_004184442.1 Undecaprenyl-phosphate 4-deoxy-4-formamido-L-arabinose transferase, putative [Entamoeba invadens IP1]